MEGYARNAIQCPHCQHEVAIDKHHIEGQTVTCPVCGHMYAIAQIEMIKWVTTSEVIPHDE
jgi:predicted Zn finger-like uncharacterized protein